MLCCSSCRAGLAIFGGTVAASQTLNLPSKPDFRRDLPSWARSQVPWLLPGQEVYPWDSCNQRPFPLSWLASPWWKGLKLLPNGCETWTILHLFNNRDLDLTGLKLKMRFEVCSSSSRDATGWWTTQLASVQQQQTGSGKKRPYMMIIWWSFWLYQGWTGCLWATWGTEWLTNTRHPFRLPSPRTPTGEEAPRSPLLHSSTLPTERLQCRSTLPFSTHPSLQHTTSLRWFRAHAADSSPVVPERQATWGRSGIHRAKEKIHHVPILKIPHPS